MRRDYPDDIDRDGGEGDGDVGMSCFNTTTTWLLLSSMELKSNVETYTIRRYLTKSGGCVVGKAELPQEV